MHSRKCKDRWKINEKIYVSVKPHETAFIRIIQKIPFISNDLYSETVKNIRKRINLCPEGLTAIPFPFSIAYFALASGWARKTGNRCLTYNVSKPMEFINKIELRGVVGRGDINSYNNSRVCNFSVVTERSTRDSDGNPAVETTWFNVSIWDSIESPRFPLEKVVRGAWVEVIGRLRLRRYTTVENEYRYSMDVLAWDVKVLSKEGHDPHMQPQRD